MNPAQRIVELFGGQTALGRLLGKKQGLAYNWCKTGRIPVKWRQDLLRIAQEKGIDLTPHHFLESDLGIVSNGAESSTPQDNEKERSTSTDDLVSLRDLGMLRELVARNGKAKVLRVLQEVF